MFGFLKKGFRWAKVLVRRNPVVLAFQDWFRTLGLAKKTALVSVLCVTFLLWLELILRTVFLLYLFGIMLVLNICLWVLLTLGLYFPSVSEFFYETEEYYRNYLHHQLVQNNTAQGEECLLTAQEQDGINESSRQTATLIGIFSVFTLSFAGLVGPLGEVFSEFLSVTFPVFDTIHFELEGFFEFDFLKYLRTGFSLIQFVLWFYILTKIRRRIRRWIQGKVNGEEDPWAFRFSEEEYYGY